MTNKHILNEALAALRAGHTGTATCRNLLREHAEALDRSGSDEETRTVLWATVAFFDENINPVLSQLGDGLVKAIYNSDWTDISNITQK